MGDNVSAASTSLAFPIGIAIDSAATSISPTRAIIVSGRSLRTESSAPWPATERRLFGDGGPAVDASLNEPSGVAVDAVLNLYITTAGTTQFAW